MTGANLSNKHTRICDLQAWKSSQNRSLVSKVV